MIYFPSCKINLGLSILRKRDDGYHEIETGMLEIPFHDILEIVPSETFLFHASGLAIPGSGNSCEDAFRLLQGEFGIANVNIHLHKNVPMGGGLGGGSADAAQTLVGLNELFALKLSDSQLEDRAAQLGSDTPFFIKGGLQLGTGRGEVLEPLTMELPKLHILLVNLGIHVPTATAYSKVVPRSDRPSLKSILEQPIEQWKAKLVNDFEVSVFAENPSLSALKDALYNAGAVYAAMTGSGSTVFGMFKEKPSVINWPQQPVMEVWV